VPEVERRHEKDQRRERDWRQRLDALAIAVHDWTGKHAGISEIGTAEIAKVARSAAGKAIRDEGIPLAGLPLRQLFTKTRAA
jgi:hypothetical protein